MLSMSATACSARVAPVAAAASQQRTVRPAFMGRPTAGAKAPLADAFNAMSLSTPTKAQQRGLSICGALSRGEQPPPPYFLLASFAVYRRVVGGVGDVSRRAVVVQVRGPEGGSRG